MELILHLNIYIFPMILLTIIYFSMQRDIIQTTVNTIFKRLLFFTLMLLIAELVSWAVDGMEFPFSRPVQYFLNIVYYSLIPVVSLSWLSYIAYYVGVDSSPSHRKRRRTIIALPVAVYYIMLLSTPFTGLVFSINTSFYHVRGVFYFIPYMLVTCYLMYALLLVVTSLLTENLAFKRKQFRFLAEITAIPVIAEVFQAFLGSFDLWIAYPATALCEMVMYIHLQRQNITTDALTGINNRGCLDSYLEDQLLHPAKNGLLSVFILDLDHFKHINDTLGHDVGDDALIMTSQTLTDLFHKSNAFISRYGGDEFCIVSHCADDAEALSVIHKIYTAFEKANADIKKPYTLSLSIGYCLLRDPLEKNISPSVLISRADEMMYENKQRRHSK